MRALTLIVLASVAALLMGVYSAMIGSPLSLGLGLAILLVIGARALEGVTDFGALLGGAFALVIYFSMGGAGFLLLFGVFMLISAVTRIRHECKKLLLTAENRGDCSAIQVATHLLPAVLTALGSVLLPRHAPLFLTAAVASLAQAAAGTVSSACCQGATYRVFLSTDFSPVDLGTPKSINRAGGLAGVITACLISLLAVFLHLISLRQGIVAVPAAILGIMLGSLLRAPRLNPYQTHDDAVTLFSAAATALTPFLLDWL